VDPNWCWFRFDELSTSLLYEILRLRQEVFVMEQNCVYLDVDGWDDKALHLIGTEIDQVVAYARVFGPGVKYPEASIGRVLTPLHKRRSGAGRALMTEAIRGLLERWPGAPIRLDAQQYLVGFYGSFGFNVVSGAYIEDGIPHVRMLRNGILIAP
jgi:ElaA protein